MAVPPINRNDFLARLAGLLIRQESNEQLFLVAVIDIKDFQYINHMHGHSVGDATLKELQKRLQTIPDKADYCSRIDGDKFALIISPVLNVQLVPLIAKKILDCVSAPFHFNGHHFEAHCNLGLAASSNGNTVAENLLMDAEAAAKKGKKTGQAYLLSEGTAFVSAKKRIFLENEVTEALENNNFELYYQPKLSLCNLRPSSAEALIRWSEATKHDINTEQLIAFIEHSKKMPSLFQWSINTALRQSAQWPTHGDPVTVAVNLSASCLKYPPLFQIIESSLNLWGKDPSMLCIEVTESAVQEDTNQGFRILNQIKELGVKVSIDDFGTGYSSLEYFKYIPADELKIDQSFIRNMWENPVDLKIVELILEWAKRFNMTTVAEGVEDQRTLEMLTELGCTHVQGYHISKALPQREFIDWLNNYDNKNSLL